MKISNFHKKHATKSIVSFCTLLFVIVDQVSGTISAEDGSRLIQQLKAVSGCSLENLNLVIEKKAANFKIVKQLQQPVGLLSTNGVSKTAGSDLHLKPVDWLSLPTDYLNRFQTPGGCLFFPKDKYCTAHAVKTTQFSQSPFSGPMGQSLTNRF